MSQLELHPFRPATLIPSLDVVWRESFRIRFFECEPNGRVSLATLCRYFQEAANNQGKHHGLSLAEMHAAGRMWVLSRFAIHIHECARVGDTIVVETWPAGLGGPLRCYRDFRIRSSTGDLLAEGWTIWFTLDVRTRRPVRLPQNLLNRQWPTFDGERLDAKKLRPPSAASETQVAEKHVLVRFSDLDPNGHASSSCYIEWLLEPLPAAFRMEKRLTSLDIVFTSEIMAGECLVSGVYAGPESTIGESRAHSLRSTAGQCIATAVTEWA